MLRMPDVNSWGYQTGNVITTRPTANYGTSITPGNNTFGSYTSILSGGSITSDCYFVAININSIGVSGVAKDALITIGIDTSGGTTYSDFIPNLLGSNATTYTIGGGIWYYFPLFVKAGSQLAAKASVNNASVGTARVAIWLFGMPSRPDSIWYGQSVESVGAVTGSSRGTTVTTGTTSEGSWTSLGTLARDCGAFQLGMGANVSNMQDLLYHLDLGTGDGTNNRILEVDARVETKSSETMSLAQYPVYAEVAAGATIYGRMQCHGGGDTGLSMIAYGVRA